MHSVVAVSVGASCHRIGFATLINITSRLVLLCSTKVLLRPHNPESAGLVHVVLRIVFGWDSLDCGGLPIKDAC